MKTWCVAIATLLASCAVPAQDGAVLMTSAQLLATPQCICLIQCEAMWAAAPAAIQDASTMDVHFSNDTMIETYVPGKIGLLHGRAAKVPNGYGGYIFIAEFDSRSELPESYKTAISIFNVEVNTAGAAGCPVAARYRR